MFGLEVGVGYIIVRKEKVIRYETKKATLPIVVVEKLGRPFELEYGALDPELDPEPGLKVDQIQPALGHVLQLFV